MDNQIKRVKVTPDVARQYLATSQGNRKTNKRRVDMYARDMMSGDWEEYNPGAIISFDMKGHLVDGHHRLLAVAKCGKAIGFLVARTNAIIFDRGSGRTTANAFQMRGLGREYYSTFIIAAARFHFAYVHGNKAPTDAELFDFIDENVEELNTALRASCAGSTNGICRKSPVIYAGFLAVKKGYSEERLRDFFTVANSGYMTSNADSAAITLRNQIMNGYNTSLPITFFYCRITQAAIRDFMNHTPRKRKYLGNVAPFEDREDIV